MTSEHSPTTTTLSALDVAAALGAGTLVQMLAGTPDGITISAADRTCVYANPSACRMLGRSLSELRGRELPGAVLTRGRDADGRDGDALTTARLPTPHGDERTVVYFTFALHMHGAPHTVAVFRDLAEPRTAVRTAVALAQTVSQLAGSAPTNEILAGIARHAVEGTRALSAGISVLGGGDGPGVGGNYGPRGPCYGRIGPSWSASDDARGEDVIAAMTGGGITAGSVPGKAIVLSDARTAWEADPVMAGFARSMRGQRWDGAICVPLAYENRVIGVLGVYLPAGLAGPSEGELAFCTTLADQAAVAVTNGRFGERAGQAAAVRERGRLARELHDSVSQALFSMTMHARAAELSLRRAGVAPAAPVSRSVEQLAALARGILAEMRALIFELRPEALAEEGLLGALTKQTAAISARADVSVSVTSSGKPVDLTGDVEKHVYRIVSEALHNVVEHAHAGTAQVTIAVTPQTVRVVVDDDGVGFDHNAIADGHRGLSDMTQLAAAIGADLTVRDGDAAGLRTPGRPGTVVTLTVPTGAQSRRAG